MGAYTTFKTELLEFRINTELSPEISKMSIIDYECGISYPNPADNTEVGLSIIPSVTVINKDNRGVLYIKTRTVFLIPKAPLAVLKTEFITMIESAAGYFYDELKGQTKDTQLAGIEVYTSDPDKQEIADVVYKTLLGSGFSEN